MIDTRVYAIVREGVLTLEVQTHITTSARTTVFLETIGNIVITAEQVDYYRWAAKAQSSQVISELASQELKVAQLFSALCTWNARNHPQARGWLLSHIPDLGITLDTLIPIIKGRARVPAAA